MLVAGPGPSERTNNVITLAKRIGLGLRRFRNYRIRALRYTGNPNWGLLDVLKRAPIR